MGTFDHLVDQRQVEWQTKDFSKPNMDRYRITDEGQLEKGQSLTLPRRYTDDPTELFAALKDVMERGPQWAWTKDHFSGIVRACIPAADNRLQWATFEFETGILLRPCGRI